MLEKLPISGKWIMDHFGSFLSGTQGRPTREYINLGFTAARSYKDPSYNTIKLFQLVVIKGDL